MYYIVDDLKRINRYTGVVIPSAKRMYDLYGFRETPMQGNEEEVIDLARNVNKLQSLSDVEAYDAYMQREELQKDLDPAE